MALPNAKHAHNAARCLWAAARRHQDHCRAPWASFTAEHGHPAERLELRLAGVWGGNPRRASAWRGSSAVAFFLTPRRVNGRQGRVERSLGHLGRPSRWHGNGTAGTGTTPRTRQKRLNGVWGAFQDVAALLGSGVEPCRAWLYSRWAFFSLGSGSERQGCVERSLGHLARLSQRGWPLALRTRNTLTTAARCLWAAARRHQDHCRAPWASFTAEHGHPAERLELRLAGVWGGNPRRASAWRGSRLRGVESCRAWLLGGASERLARARTTLAGPLVAHSMAHSPCTGTTLTAPRSAFDGCQ